MYHIVFAASEQVERAFNLGLAAILGDGVYNFGELVSYLLPFFNGCIIYNVVEFIGMWIHGLLNCLFLVYKICTLLITWIQQELVIKE